MSWKILIVEDDQPIRDMYSYKFEHEKFTVKVASDGKEGLTLAETFLPDLILLDLRMPVMDGETMLKKLRETDWGESIRVIILTNLSKREAPLSLSVFAVSRYIVKAHATPSQVVQIVHEVLGNN